VFPEPELITIAIAKDLILVIGYQNGKVRIYVNTGAGYFIYRTIQSDGKIYDLLISGDTLWVAGSFKKIRGIPQSGIAAFDFTST
jgi:hypothetical protein